MNILSSLLFLILPASAFAQQAEFCPERVERHGSIQLEQSLSTDKATCLLSIHNFKQEGLIYRDYLLTSTGDLMIFNSYGDGPESSTTGAREFFLFPRPNKSISYKWNDEDRRLEILDANGGMSYYDYEDAQITFMSHGTVKVAPQVVDTNKGGVEISQFQGLLLDVGFTKGRAPSQVSSAYSTFTDQAGTSCKVKNLDIFKSTSDGDILLRYSDQGLAALLKSKCPKIKFSPST